MNFKKFGTQVPSDYQELTFIANSGTQYIDTGLVGTDLYGCEIEICMKVTKTTPANLYYLNGAYVAGHTTQSGLIREDDEYAHSVVNMGFNSPSYSGSIALSDWHTIYTSDGIQKIDGVIFSNKTYGTLNNLRYLLFARSDTGITISPPFAIKYFWVKKNGQYIRNMIPVRRKSDNQLGLYDKANDVFYTNQGTGNFTAGTIVKATWDDIPHYIHNTSTDIITTLPAVIYPNDTTATIGLKGRTVQSGTPTPDNPIMPQGTGERTWNLWNYTIEQGGWSAAAGTIPEKLVPGDTNYPIRCRVGYMMPIPSNTMSFTCPSSIKINFVWIDANGVSMGGSGWQRSGSTVTVPENATTLTFILAKVNDSNCSPNDFQNIMLNSGSTALPYEPYGYKLDISSGDTTTPVYLGEAQTTRQIEKLVLTGNESMYDFTYQNRKGIVITDILDGEHTRGDGFCSHYPVFSGVYNANTLWIGVNDAALYFIGITDVLGFSDYTRVKAYIAAQYAAGTPVIVWYILATPTTGIVNEPLMRIGDYTDEVANVSIPVTVGENTISVDTTVQPSEVTVNYKGWHPVQNVHKYDSNYTIATMQALTVAQLQTHAINDLQGGEWL
jgi:hypothetical protein